MSPNLKLGKLKSTIGAALFAVCLAQPAQATLVAAGPAAVPAPPGTGFPPWYQDPGLLKAELCNFNTAFCILAVTPIPTLPLPIADETFYWLADGTVTLPGVCDGAGCSASIRVALEAAFLNGPVEVGRQMVFGRTRIFANLPDPGLYRFTYPFGVREFQVDAVRVGLEITRAGGTTDVGCVAAPCNFTAAFASDPGPFLYWDTGLPLTDATGQPYIGDAVTPHKVFGSPTGNNIFRVERIVNGVPVLLGETDQFIIMGRVFLGDGNTAPTLANDVTDPATGKPLAMLANPAGTAANALSSKAIDVLANDTPVNVAINPTTLAPAASANATVTVLRGPNDAKVRALYTPTAGFAGPDTFTYNAATFTGLTAAPATVSIIVEDLQAPIAEFLPKLMKWRIEGTSNTGGAGVIPNTMEIRLGTTADAATGLPNGPLLGTAQVDAATGRWVFSGKSTVSPAAVPRTATGAIPISVTSGNGVARTGIECTVR